MRIVGNVRRRPRRLAGALGAALAAIGIAVAVAASPDATIDISGFAFGQPQLTVPVGTRVVWTNRDDIPHTVTSAANPRLFGSQALDTGGRFSRTFDRPGVYRYYCAIHPHMQGVVVVK